MSFPVLERGQPNTLEYRVFFRNAEGNVISPFHDIPLYASKYSTAQQSKESNIFNMVVEIPRWTNAKMEICKEEKLNPIKQDVKKGKLRYVKNIFPHHGYIWNYGALPQTWEDPNHKFEGTAGDSDPLDVCEIGYKIHKRGDVIQVKVLGTMLLIDEGETDWKIIAIDVTDPLAAKLNDVADIEKEMPGLLKATCEWFRFYKVPDGKPENHLAWDGVCKNKEYALGVIDDANKLWKKFMEEPSSGVDIQRTNISVFGCPDKVSAEASQSTMEQSPAPGPPAPVDQDVNKWYYPIPQ